MFSQLKATAVYFSRSPSLSYTFLYFTITIKMICLSLAASTVFCHTSTDSLILFLSSSSVCSSTHLCFSVCISSSRLLRCFLFVPSLDLPVSLYPSSSDGLLMSASERWRAAAQAWFYIWGFPEGIKPTTLSVILLHSALTDQLHSYCRRFSSVCILTKAGNVIIILMQDQRALRGVLVKCTNYFHPHTFFDSSQQIIQISVNHLWQQSRRLSFWVCGYNWTPHFPLSVPNCSSWVGLRGEIIQGPALDWPIESVLIELCCCLWSILAFSKSAFSVRQQQVFLQDYSVFCCVNFTLSLQTVLRPAAGTRALWTTVARPENTVRWYKNLIVVSEASTLCLTLSCFDVPVIKVTLCQCHLMAIVTALLCRLTVLAHIHTAPLSLLGVMPGKWYTVMFQIACYINIWNLTMSYPFTASQLIRNLKTMDSEDLEEHWAICKMRTTYLINS